MDHSPHSSGFVTANGIRLHYLDWGGSGPALLFLPGRGCNGHIFDNFAPRFSSHFRVLALDRRGHGDSDHPETGYDIEALVEDLRRFLDALHIEQVILVGHSMAGIELTHFAALYPERVLKLVYLDAAYDYSCPEYKALLENHPMRKITIPGADQEFHSVEDYAAFIRYAYPSLNVIWSELLDEHLLHEVEMDAQGKVVDKMSEAVDKAIGETIFAYQPEYSAIRAPTLTIDAIKDATYYLADYHTPEQRAELTAYFDTVIQPWNRQSNAKFRREVPHAQVVEIPHGHHYVFIPHAEQVFDAMMAFLAAEDSPVSSD